MFCKVADGDELRLSNHLRESIIAKSGDVNVPEVVVGFFGRY